MFSFSTKSILNKLTLLSAMLFILSCQGERPLDLGIQNIEVASGETKNGLSACPETPNCVVSFLFDQGEDHYLEPISFQQDLAHAKKAITSIINSTPRAEIIINTENYIYAEFTSRIFRFVDDVEFYFSDDEELIHFRSASRLGKSDLGANSKRIERIRFRYHQRDY